jgi:hypothetical protein
MDARELLVADSALPACHSLHLLQMACEKLCKASMISSGSDPLEVQRSHAYIAKHLPTIVRLYLSREAGRLPRDNWIVEAIRPLARKIELLNPAVKDGGRAPHNCEYPWEAQDGTVVAPADHNFEFTMLFERAGVRCDYTTWQIAWRVIAMCQVQRACPDFREIAFASSPGTPGED